MFIEAIKQFEKDIIKAVEEMDGKVHYIRINSLAMLAIVEWEKEDGHVTHQSKADCPYTDDGFGLYSGHYCLTKDECNADAIERWEVIRKYTSR